MDESSAILTTLIILVTFCVSVILPVFNRRRSHYALRPLPAYAAIPAMVADAVEAGRPLHVSWGSAGLGGLLTPLTLASAEMFHQVAQRAASGSITPLLTTSNASALPLGYSTLQRAYRARGRMERYSGRVRWLPGGESSLAFAAAVSVFSANERVAGSALVGSFGTELALILDAAQRKRQVSLAGSDKLDGMAVAYALADHALIGEELFTASAYLGDEQARNRATVVTLDALRWLLIFLLFVLALVSLSRPVMDSILSFVEGR